MDTLFLIYVEGYIGNQRIIKTYGPYVTLVEASTVMLTYVETILEIEGIFFTQPHHACVMEVLPNAGHWLEIAIKATDTPNKNGTRTYDESI